jgi:hypothetical protein
MKVEEIEKGLQLLNENIQPYRMKLILATREDPIEDWSFEKSLEYRARLLRRMTEDFKGWIVKFTSWGIALYKEIPQEFRRN